MINMAAWHAKQLTRTDISTAEYLTHYNALEDIKFRQRVLDAEYEERIKAKPEEVACSR